MRVRHLALPPPSCLVSVQTTRAEGDVREALIRHFIPDEEDAQDRARHESLERPEPWVSTRDELEVWFVGCPCGQATGKLFGVREHDEFAAPVFHACVTCNRRALIFDPVLHGYNAEVSKKKRKPRQTPNATMAMLCRGCKTSVWRPVVLVTYQGELDPRHPRLTELFDVVLIGGICAQCERIDFRYHAECA